MGETIDDAGAPIAWGTCPDLPGAYEEAPTSAEALARLRTLARHIIAEHIVRDDALDPAIVSADTPAPSADTTLVIALSEAEIEEVRALPLLQIEQPEP